MYMDSSHGGASHLYDSGSAMHAPGSCSSSVLGGSGGGAVPRGGLTSAHIMSSGTGGGSVCMVPGVRAKLADRLSPAVQQVLFSAVTAVTLIYYA
jgi:hypothetical protein